MDANDLIDRFRSHAPKADADTADRLQRACNLYLDLVQDINFLVADCREKSLAVTHLEESKMWLSKAIARYQ